MDLPPQPVPGKQALASADVAALPGYGWYLSIPSSVVPSLLEGV